jgi:hypothetical protein
VTFDSHQLDDLALPRPGTRLGLPAQRPAQLLVLVATEEEFDWNSAVDPKQDSVESLAGMERFLELACEDGLRPTLVVDYPVVSQAPDALRRWREAGLADIGSHLHPWVNPPYFPAGGAVPESFPGALDPQQERAKLELLTEAIAAAVGASPKVYQAGRYGLGPRTPVWLEQLGYRVDTSPSPGFDYSAEGGPNFTAWPPGATRFEGYRDLICLPVTGSLFGGLARWGGGLHRRLQGRSARSLKLGAVLSRSGLLERVRLSPEGADLPALQRLTRTLMARGERIFTLYFHSPSLVPGHTEYVRSEAELEAFLGVLQSYWRWFRDELGGAYHTHEALAAELQVDADARA